MQMTKEQLAKCPAFVEGCPFKADTTLEAFVSHLEGMKASPAIAKCPAFKDGGCPFSEMLAKDKIGKCPAFSSGCPFTGAKKAEQTGVHALETTLRQITGQSDAYGDAVADLLAAYFRDSPSGVAVLHSVLGKVHTPASSSGCPVTGSKKSMPLDTSKCPAFTDGCPYKGVMQMTKEQLAKCPAFVEGCPFKADTTLEAFVSHLEGMKASPAIAKCPAFKDGGCPFSEMLAKDKIGKCPAFSSGCPFTGASKTKQPTEGGASGCPFQKQQNPAEAVAPEEAESAAPPPGCPFHKAP